MTSNPTPPLNPPGGVIRVGLLGASGIAHKVWAAIEATGMLRVTLVASRELSRATAFIVSCAEQLHIHDEHLPTACTYEDLVCSPEVDVVYISLPVTCRHEWVMKCAQNGKHVVGEKPPAASCEQLRTWLDALAARKLLYVDGTMFSHGTYIEQVVKHLSKVGTVRRIASVLARMATPEEMKTDIRFQPSLEPLGALGDCGWYCVRSILHVMNFALPTTVTGRIVEQAPNGAVLAFSGELIFDASGETVSAYFYCSLNSAAQAEFTVFGTDATIEAPNLTNPLTDQGPVPFKICRGRMKTQDTEMTTSREEDVIKVPQETGHFQETQMWRNIHHALRWDKGSERLIVDDKMAEEWGKRAWITQFVLENLMAAAQRLPLPSLCKVDSSCFVLPNKKKEKHPVYSPPY